MGRQAVFLDRDGTINRNAVIGGKPYAPTRLEDFHYLPGVAGAIARFHEAGLLTIVVTNQPDIATGKNSWAVLDAMHARLRRDLGVSDILVCPHVDADGCTCRKPKPGLLLEAAARWGIDLARSAMIGDRWSDVAAGLAAGCLSVHIDHGYEGDRPARGAALTTASLAEAAEFILSALAD